MFRCDRGLTVMWKHGYVGYVLVDNDRKCGQLESADGILVLEVVNDFRNTVTSISVKIFVLYLNLTLDRSST